MTPRNIAPTPTNMSLWAWRGVMTFAVVFALGWLVFSALVANPVEKGAQHVAQPVARSLGIIQGQCPGGWQSAEIDAGDVQALTCTKDPWVVTLSPDGSFSHALNTGDQNAQPVYAPEEVPGWLSD